MCEVRVIHKDAGYDVGVILHLTSVFRLSVPNGSNNACVCAHIRMKTVGPDRGHAASMGAAAGPANMQAHQLMR